MSNLVLCAEIEASGGTRYFSNRIYATFPTDTPDDELFSGRLVDVIYERALSFPVWSRGGGGNSVSGVELANIDGALDSWRSESWKDRRIVLKAVAPRAAYSTAVLVGSVVIEKLETIGQSRIRLVCRSTLERLAKPITRVYSQSISNTQMRGQPKPLVLGRVRWAEPRAQRINAGVVRGLYDLTDDVYESIAEVRSRGGIIGASPAETALSGTYFVDADECFGFRYGPQSERMCAEIRGNVRRDTNLTANADFPSGTGGDPDGWTVSESGTSTVTWNAAGSVTIVGNASVVSLLQTLTVVNGGHYQLEIEYSVSTGVTQLSAAGIAIREVDNIGPRTIMASFTAASTSVAVGISISSGATANATITAIRCYRIYRIDSLSEMLRFAAVSRLGLTTSDLDLTACAAIEATSAYRLALASNSELSGDALMRQASLSYGVAFFQDRNSKLRPARLVAPAVTADYDLIERQVIGDITFEPDLAPGLTTRMNYGRNYVVHSENDMAAETNAAIRAELAREKRTVTTSVTLHSMYAADAAGREPFETLLSESADAQNEIDRLCNLYTVPRAFFTLRARVDSSVEAYTIEPGQTINLTHRRYGLGSGRNLLVVLARSDFTTGAVDLTLWGEA